MYPLAWALISFLFLSSNGNLFVRMDQNATCTMDDKVHKAYYQCPDGYDAIYSGEGEKECNCKCYAKGSRAGLRDAIAALLIDRKVIREITDKQLIDALDTLVVKEEVTLSSSHGMIRLRAPKQEIRRLPTQSDPPPAPKPSISPRRPTRSDPRPIPKVTATPPGI